MTSDEIRAAIAADPALQALASARADDGALAAALSAGTEPYTRRVSERAVLDEFPGGPVAADAVLSKLDAFAASAQPLASLVRRAMRFVQMPDGLDLGSTSARLMLDQLAAEGVITAQEAAGLKGLAERHVSVSVAEVVRALEGM